MGLFVPEHSPGRFESKRFRKVVNHDAAASHHPVLIFRVHRQGRIRAVIVHKIEFDVFRREA